MLRLTIAALLVAGFVLPLYAETSALHTAEEMPVYLVADASAPPVTASSLLASERFWPYQVALREPLPRGGGRAPLAAGTLGVLIRVEERGDARVDFGRDGLLTLPVRATDLVARANEIRSGTATKVAPNFVFAIGPRLLDAEAQLPVRLALAKSADRAGFLALFADPSAPSFPRLASALAPLAGKGRVLPVLFAQGAHPDAALHARLRAAGWRGAFVMDHLAEAYTRTLIDDATGAPTLALYSAEGRVLWSGAFDGAIPPGLERAWPGGGAAGRP